MTTAFSDETIPLPLFTASFLHRVGRLGASLLAAGVLLAVALVPATQAQHPTAVTSIVNSNADTTLEVNHNGSLLMPGNLVTDGTANDSIPAEGAGTRMMWYPAKAAFRAGRVGSTSGKGDVWDADSVGRSSVAFGVDTKANGFAATAMGRNTTASRNQATAMGRNTTASGFNATAMGFGTTASGPGATAMGEETTASGFYATAMGNQTTASGEAATAMGNQTTAATDQSLSIGKYNSANTSSDGTLFVAGNGSTNDRSDALVLDGSGNLTISGTLTENSDRRLKTSVAPMNGGTLKKLLALRPVRFEFKNQKTHSSGEQLGLIAQDVRKEFPQLVTEGTGGMLSLSYSKLTAVLLKGIQEQQSQIKKQQATIEKQQTQINKQQATIGSLKQKVQQIESVKKRLAALERQSRSSLPAGWGLSGLLALLIGLGGFGAGLLWRRRS